MNRVNRINFFCDICLFVPVAVCGCVVCLFFFWGGGSFLLAFQVRSRTTCPHRGLR